MTTINTTEQIILIVLILIYNAGFSIVPSWPSYLIRSFIMYLMGSVVLNKMKVELKELQGIEPMGEKTKGQWRK